MAERNKVEIRIAGKDYKLVGVEADEYIQRIGLYVDKKMNEILKQNSKLSTSMAAVLTALNVADDFVKTKEREKDFKKQYSAACEKIKVLQEEKVKLAGEKEKMAKQNTELQLELAKREAELREVRKTLEKSSRTKV